MKPTARDAGELLALVPGIVDSITSPTKHPMPWPAGTKFETRKRH
jgi:hypothetical protein